MLATLQPWQKTLLEAAELIKERGLAKGCQEDSDGRLCIHGALTRTKGYTGWGEAEQRMADYLKSQNLLDASSFGCAPWNNAPERTAEEVIAALQQAALT